MVTAETPDHFYAGIRAKMQRQEQQPQVRSFNYKPVFVTSLLFIFLVANIIVLKTNRVAKADEETAISPAASMGIQQFASEYNFNSKSFGQ